MQVRRFRILFSYFAITILASSAATAAPVVWEGETWADTYGGNTSLSVTGGNLLVTPTNPSNFAAAHYNTSTSFRAAATPWVEFSFLETGNSSVRKGVWFEDETTASPAGGWLQFDNPAVGLNYRVYYNDYDADLLDGGGLDFSAGLSQNTSVARTSGEQTFKIGRRDNGTIDFWINGTLATSLTPAQFNPNFFGDIYLAAQGETATYTSFATGTDYAVPEPTSALLAAAAGLGLFVIRRRRKA